MKLARLIDGRTVAVIGNSACETGKGRGAEIDAHDVVFRFNEFSLEHGDDYGTKLTAWITAHNGNPLSCPVPVGIVYCPLWLIQSTFHKVTTPSDFMPRAPFDALYERARAPSTGMAFLWWLSTLRPLHTCGIYGFTFFDPHTSHHYWEHVHWPLTHDRARELEMFRDLYLDGCDTNGAVALKARNDSRFLLEMVHDGTAAEILF